MKSMKYSVLAVAAVLLSVSCSSAPTNSMTNRKPTLTSQSDPYLWLEEIESEAALDWVRSHNAKTISALTQEPSYPAIEADLRKILLAEDRLPFPYYRAGHIENFWQDSKNVRGIWRRTTLSGYRKEHPSWETLIDLDELAKKKGELGLARSRLPAAGV